MQDRIMCAPGSLPGQAGGSHGPRPADPCGVRRLVGPHVTFARVLNSGRSQSVPSMIRFRVATAVSTSSIRV